MKNKKIMNAIWGGLLIVVGVFIALKAFGVLTFDLFFDGWWTLFIIIPCGIGLFSEKDKTGNIIGLLVGVALLLACQDVFDFDIIWKLLIPAVVIIIGGKLLYKSLKKNNDYEEVENYPNKGEKSSVCAVFGGSELKPQNEIFRGAELTAVFGGIECDLRQAILEEDCVINATAIFGGIDIWVPSNVKVKVDSTSLFGGVSTKKKPNNEDGEITVYVNGTSMFGGIEIK